MPIKVILFDLGNVIVFVDHMHICAKIAAWGGNSADIYHYIFTERIEEALDRGEITPVRFFDAIKERFDLRLDYDDFLNVWSSGFVPNEEIIPLIEELKCRYRLSLLSNTNQAHFEAIRRDVPILSTFETCFLSYEMGLRKPDPRIYERVLEAMHIMPGECVYIDDNESFVQAARCLGIRGVVFSDVPGLRRELKRELSTCRMEGNKTARHPAGIRSTENQGT